MVVVQVSADISAVSVGPAVASQATAPAGAGDSFGGHMQRALPASEPAASTPQPGNQSPAASGANSAATNTAAASNSSAQAAGSNSQSAPPASGTQSTSSQSSASDSTGTATASPSPKAPPIRRRLEKAQPIPAIKPTSTMALAYRRRLFCCRFPFQCQRPLMPRTRQAQLAAAVLTAPTPRRHKAPAKVQRPRRVPSLNRWPWPHKPQLPAPRYLEPAATLRQTLLLHRQTRHPRWRPVRTRQ